MPAAPLPTADGAVKSSPALISTPDDFTRRFAATIERLYVLSGAATWALERAAFADALFRSARAAGIADDALESYLATLKVDDLALAAACCAGNRAAWEHFIDRYRPVLRAAARAIVGDDERGRELADSLFAELYGVDARAGARHSLFDYFHGRSSLATWLRAVLAQRHVDSIRASRRFEPLESAGEPAADHAGDPPDPDRARYVAMLGRALDVALQSETPRDRMRLGYYYRHRLTLKEIGRVMGEHESTVSRALAATRARIRARIEQALRGESGLSDDQISLCYVYGSEDLPLDLARALPEAK
jgi:RNA polymerase sigma factor (sigma-70 family)